MLDDRKAAVLRAVVREYIETAQPVGSAHVARTTNLGVSSATLRNEMATLERDGYLTQPHTSAGRVPTDKGYRFFVDQLTGPGALPAPQRQQVRDFFARAHGELEQMLHDTSSLLSGLTSYAALVLAPASERATVRSVQVVGLTDRLAMAVAVLSNGTVEKAMIELDDMGEERLAAASTHLSAHLDGASLAEANPIPATGDRRLDRLVDAVLDAFGRPADRDHDHVYVGGASRMATSFEAVDTVRQVLAILEQQYVVVSLLREVLDNEGDPHGLSVSIGTELGVQPLAECSIVVAPYAIEGEVLGTVGVLGPTRMNYPQAMAAVAIVSERLGRTLSA